jgi:hypothetical protein
MSDWPGPRGKELSMPLEEFELFQKAQEKMKLDREAMLAEAEARGFERGVREAAKVLREGPRNSGLPWPNPDKAILALLEKPTETKQP